MQETFECLFMNFRSDPMDWGMRVLTHLSEENIAPSNMLNRVRLVDKNAVGMFMFEVIDCIYHSGLVKTENHHVWFEQYIEGAVIVTISEEVRQNASHF